MNKPNLPDKNNDSSDSAPDSLSGLLTHFVDTTEGQDKVKIVHLLDSLDSRSHGPMLLFPAIIAISPIGMVPGMSVITGTLIILIAGQMMFFSGKPWIPDKLEDFEFSREKLTSGVEKTKPWVKMFEKVVYNRFEFLAGGAVIYPIAIISILLALSFYPLAFVPLGVFAPGFAITMFALGLTARDGLLVAFGFVLTAVAIGMVWFAWPF
ncbi:exopolysaccharide biosynthesis protein [Mariniblastus fucicola]|uniref:Exopolysaccharide synthesis, ExoD n=1 Tax=Mariniblastus fucicola TaxID=980251 RepID=A0A5B9PGC7_9BACT|nr:exopolysaccharide biosynthesis protein [Mariniblastus fucicola]QEG24659.1 Exopolysaccharide synthesis, ExoD [Mariniblastus fucicola]